MPIWPMDHNTYSETIGWQRLAHLPHMGISETTGRIFLVRSSVELPKPVVVQYHGHLPIWPHMGFPMGQTV